MREPGTPVRSQSAWWVGESKVFYVLGEVNSPGTIH